VTPSGIEPATFRFVAQHLNHCATAVPGVTDCDHLIFRLHRVDIVIETVKNSGAAGYIILFGLVFSSKGPDIFLSSSFSASIGSPSEFLIEHKRGALGDLLRSHPSYDDVAALCARSSHLVATNSVFQSLLTICAGEELFSLRSVT
jgi:hypothetical protein